MASVKVAICKNELRIDMAHIFCNKAASIMNFCLFKSYIPFNCHLSNPFGRDIMLRYYLLTEVILF